MKGDRFTLARNARETFRPLADIADCVCAVARITIVDLASTRREQRVVSARRACTVLMRQLPVSLLGHRTPSFPEIAQVIGMGNHSTAITSHDAAYRDALAKEYVAEVCKILSVPQENWPVCRTPETPRKAIKFTGCRRKTERARLKAERAARIADEVAIEIAFENLARQILGRVCEVYGISVDYVRGPTQGEEAKKARRAFACIVLDTDVCGRMVSVMSASMILGRRSLDAARSARATGRKNPEEIASVCARLGLDPPPYARKAGAA